MTPRAPRSPLSHSTGVGMCLCVANTGPASFLHSCFAFASQRSNTMPIEDVLEVHRYTLHPDPLTERPPSSIRHLEFFVVSNARRVPRAGANDFCAANTGSTALCFASTSILFLRLSGFKVFRLCLSLPMEDASCRQQRCRALRLVDAPCLLL